MRRNAVSGRAAHRCTSSNARSIAAIVLALSASVYAASRAESPAPGSVILRATGPIEVSGSPESFAVAWIDESSGTRDLSLAIYEDGTLPRVRHLSKDVDRGQPILFSKHLEQVAVGWRE